MPNWRKSFDEYLSLLHYWKGDRRIRQIVSAVLEEEDDVRNALLDEKVSGGARAPTDELLDAGARLRSAIADAGAHRGIYDNPYHLATAWISRWHWYPDRRNRDACFRGQVHSWPVEPAILRFLPNDPAQRATEVETRLSQLSVFLKALRQTYGTQFDVDQYVAIAQHYGIRTWLIDVSESPWVALFFASWNGLDGDTGIVHEFRIHEVAYLGQGHNNPIGTINFVNANKIARIRRQRGLFLDGMHPEIIQQYSPYSLAFRQRSGVTFEARELGVSEAQLFPASAEDPFAVLGESSDLPDRRFLARELNPEDYERVARIWMKERGYSTLPTVAENILRTVCSVHCHLQRWNVKGVRKSIHQLNHATQLIGSLVPEKGGSSFTPEEIMRMIVIDYTSGIRDARAETAVDKLFSDTLAKTSGAVADTGRLTNR